MDNALKFLLDREWSMGNGQCPECEAVHSGWYGHPLYQTSAEIGHENNCQLAQAIKELGGEPLMIGALHGPVKISQDVLDLNKHLSAAFERELLANLGL